MKNMCYALLNLAICFAVIFDEWPYYPFVVVYNYILFAFFLYRAYGLGENNE